MKIFNFLRQIEFRLNQEFSKRNLSLRPVKFIITGSISSVSGLLTIFILVDGFGFWPVWGTVWANVVSGLIGFLLHKHWTFGNKSEAWHWQAVFYFGLVLLNLVASAGLMYVLNELLGVWYLLAQVLIIFGMTTFNFFFDKLVVFKQK